MSPALWLEAVVAALLVVTVVYCVLLNRRLSRLRDAQDQLQGLLDGFAKATEQAEASIAELKRACGELGGELQAKVEGARRLCDELTVMTQAGDDLANRLERGIMSRRGRADRPGAPGSGPDDRTGGGRAGPIRSESEQELLEALRQAR